MAKRDSKTRKKVTPSSPTTRKSPRAVSTVDESETSTANVAMKKQSPRSRSPAKKTETTPSTPETTKRKAPTDKRNAARTPTKRLATTRTTKISENAKGVYKRSAQENRERNMLYMRQRRLDPEYKAKERQRNTVGMRKRRNNPDFIYKESYKNMMYMRKKRLSMKGENEEEVSESEPQTDDN